MRVKITEKQLKRIKEQLTEQVDKVVEFEQFCKDKVQEVNKIYSKVIGLSVAEIINNEVNISKIVNYVWELENTLIWGKKKEADNYIETLSDKEAENLDLRIDDAYSFIVKKIDSLNLILEGLDDLQKESEETELLKSFSDVKPIDINPQEF
jgi:hypothetical protein